jgi:hypothetical protein
MYKSEFNQAKEITTKEYLNLKEPIFIGQSRIDEKDMYWTLFRVDTGINYEYYKIHNKL